MNERQTKILIVDDDRELSEAQATVLARRGYLVSQAASGDEAIALALRERPDIIILDVVLEGEDGIELCSRLRRELGAGDYLIALASGMRIEAEDRTKGYEAGADDYIAKPVGNVEFLARIGHLERIAGQLRELRHAAEEKGTLVREAHHRIKNDLFSIEGLIELRGDSAAGHREETLLQDLGARIHAIASVHEGLYNSEDQSRIDARSYIGGLVEKLSSGIRASGPRIELLASVEELEIPAGSAARLGMVVTELVGNAIRHAFPGRPDGRVRIGLEARLGGLRLRVADDGIGLPPGFRVSEASNLGLGLVAKLVESLGGGLSILEGPGASFVIDLPPVD